MARPIGIAGPPDPMLLREIGRSATGVDLALLFGAMLVVVGIMRVGMFAVGSAAEPGATTQPEQDARVESLALTVIMGTLAMVLAIVISRWRGLTWSAMGVTWRRWPLNLPLGLATTGAAFVVFICVAQVIRVVWPAGFAELLGNAERVRQNMPEISLVGLVALTVFVGIWEEVVFRGFMLPRLRRLTESWVVAVLLSSTVFAVLHLGGQVSVIAIPVFFLGVLFCVVTIWRRSLVPAVVGHFVFDLIQLIAITGQAPGVQH